MTMIMITKHEAGRCVSYCPFYSRYVELEEADINKLKFCGNANYDKPSHISPHTMTRR